MEKIIFREGQETTYIYILDLLAKYNEYDAIRILKQYEKDILSLESFFYG